MNATTTYFAPPTFLPATGPSLPSGWLQGWRATPSTAKTRQRRPTLERHLRKALRRRLPINLGTPAEPWIPTTEGLEQARILFADLKPLEGRLLRITTDSPEILGELPTLELLDQRHALEVSLLIPSLCPRRGEQNGERQAWLDDRWSAIRCLSAAGLLTRVLIPWSVDLDHSDQVVEASFAAARTHGAEDVVGLPPCSGDSDRRGWAALRRPAVAVPEQAQQWLQSCHRLRLQYGFPRGLPGRG